MTGVRRRQGRFPAHVLYVLSVFALLAFASFPALAGADSSNIQYSDAPPTATGGKEPTHEAPAKSSKSQNGSTSTNTSAGKESHSSQGNEPGSRSPKSDDAAPGSPGGGKNGGTGSQGSRESGSRGNPGSSLQQGTQEAKSLAGKDDGGGSSPLVPILIAIAVLAAVSIGAVMMRQRRQRGSASPGSVSPKAS